MLKNIFSGRRKDKKLKSGLEKESGSKLKNIKLKKIKYIPKILSKGEKLLVLGLILIIFGSFIWLGIQAYPRYIQENPAYGGSYVEGVVGQPQFLNPILAPASDSDLDITRLVFSSLLQYNKKQELAADLAEKYEISEDQKNYTFFLKKGVKWHDGEELTADDVVFTVQSIKNPEYQSPLRANFMGVAIEKVDDYTVKFTLTGDTFAPFLKENTTFGILPQHIWQKIPSKNITLSEYNLEPVGSGPFKFKEYKIDKKTNIINAYSLVTFEDYFSKKPYIEEFTFKFYNDYAELISAYNKKEVEGLSYIPASEKSNLKKEIDYYLLRLPRYYAIFFNQSKNKFLEDKEVRQALIYGTDRQRIINEALDGEGVIIDSPILKGFLGHNPEVKKYEFDPIKANEILHKAGWDKINDDGYRTKKDKELEITLTYASQSEFDQISHIITENWKEIGVKTNLQEIDSTILQSEYIRPRNYEALIYGQLISHDPDPYPFWHSSQREDPGLNLTSFKNKSADNLLEEARKTNDEKERRTKYLHFQNIIAEESPALFLYSPTYLYGVNKKVRGIDLEFITTPSDRFTDMVNWYIKIKRGWKQ